MVDRFVMNTKVTMTIVDGAVFIMSPSKVRVPGLLSHDPKPLVLFAGGSWISDSAKAWGWQNKNRADGIFELIISSKKQWLYPCQNLEAKDFLSKAANENKAIEFRIESSSQKDSLFEIWYFSLLGWAGWGMGIKINWNHEVFFTRRKLIKLFYDFQIAKLRWSWKRTLLLVESAMASQCPSLLWWFNWSDRECLIWSWAATRFSDPPLLFVGRMKTGAMPSNTWQAFGTFWEITTCWFI